MAQTYTIDDVIEDLQEFIYYLAHRNDSIDTIMMDFDEIVGELSEELVKGFYYYQDKDLTKPQMLAAIRKILDNRISELIYKYFKTHRVAGINYVPVDSLAEQDDDVDVVSYKLTRVDIQAFVAISPSPEAITDSQDRVYELFTSLSPNAQRVMGAIIKGNELLSMNIDLSIQRASHAFKNGTVKMQPWHVADSIGISEQEVKKAFQEIRQEYKRICENG